MVVKEVSAPRKINSRVGCPTETAVYPDCIAISVPNSMKSPSEMGLLLVPVTGVVGDEPGISII